MTLEERIGYRFRDQKYLRRALTHSSFSNESPPAQIELAPQVDLLGEAEKGPFADDGGPDLGQVPLVQVEPVEDVVGPRCSPGS